MYHRGMKWETYLEFDGFKDNVVDGLVRERRALADSQEHAARQIASAQRQSAQAIVSAQAEAAGQIAAAEATTTATLDRGFGALIASQSQMQMVMDHGFAAVAYGTQQIAGGIEALRADFDWAMGALLWKLEVQQDALKDILATLQAPLSTEARELRERAEFAYSQGWYNEALGDFLGSEKRNYQDFAIHQAIGNIYLYHARPLDLDKAREYYLKAARYAAPRSAYHAALGYLHAGFVCYLQNDDDAALENARQAVTLYPSLIEAHYNQAKFAAAAGRADVALPALETAIRTDRNYAIKARADTDFGRIEDAVAGLMEQLRAEAERKAMAQWRPLQDEVARYVLATQDEQKLSPRLAEVTTLLEKGTYFSYLDAIPRIAQCRNIFEGLQLSGRDRVQQEAVRLLQELLPYMAKHNIPAPTDTQMQREAAELEQVLPGTLTYHEASAARDRVQKLKTQWDALRLPERDQLQRETIEILPRLRPEMDSYILHEGFQTWMSQELTVAEAKLAQIATYADAKALRDHIGKVEREWASAGETGWVSLVLTARTEYVKAVAFSPDGRTLASASHGTIRLWDTRTGQERVNIHERAETAIAFSPDGQTLVWGEDDGRVHFANPHNGQTLKVVRGRDLETKDPFFVAVYDIAFSPDGSKLALAVYGNQPIRFIDRIKADYRPRGDWTSYPFPKDVHVKALAFSPDGRWLAAAGDRLLWLIKVAQIGFALGPKESVTNHYFVTFSPDGSTLVTTEGSGGKIVRFWDARTLQPQGALNFKSGVSTVAYSPDGTTLACGCETDVYLWDVHKNCYRAVLKGHRSSVNMVAFSPDGTLLASCSNDNTVRLWSKALTRVEQERQTQEQRRLWCDSGCCEECGTKLSAFEKLGGHKRCKQHRIKS